MRMRLASVLLLLIVSGCATSSVRDSDKMRTHFTARAGVEKFTLLDLTASVPDEGMSVEVTSDLGDLLADLFVNSVTAGGGLVGDVIEYAAGFLGRTP